MLKSLSALIAFCLPAGPVFAQAVPAAALFDGTRGKPPAFTVQAAPSPDGENIGWTPSSPDDESGDYNPGAPERSTFWDRLQDGAFDQICKNIKLRTSQRLAVEGLGVGLKVDRHSAELGRQRHYRRGLAQSRALRRAFDPNGLTTTMTRGRYRALLLAGARRVKPIAGPPAPI